jgi:glycosyltransferase involved in cell wall biosynthesis
VLISIIIRTYNEERHLGDVLSSIEAQECDADVEVVLVDSGSTDNTIQIAGQHGCRIITISKQDFTFGRSLNRGCAAANGEILVFVSGHCIPVDSNWLQELVAPLVSGDISYCYGRQIGGKAGTGSKFSESQLFRKHYPKTSALPQEGFFCNNANSAIRREQWAVFGFDEQLTGLEDMALAKKICESGGRIGYAAGSVVYHLHDESWRAVKNRFEREAIALQAIMPQIHITFGDFLRYWASAVFMDFGAALQERVVLRNFWQILAYRFVQFWGSYKGNNEHRKLSQSMKDKYFYPK